MAKRTYSDLAFSIVETGGWQHEKPENGGSHDEQMQTAILLHIACSLRRIESLLRCPNIQRGLKSMSSLEHLAREFWVKPVKKRQPRKNKRARSTARNWRR